MIVPLVLTVLSLAGVAAALLLPGYGDLALLPGMSAIAAVILLLVSLLRRRAASPTTQPTWIVVDGSNVLHWKDGTPQIGALRDVVKRLSALGYTPGVVFDANAGYLISGRYQHDYALGRLLGLSEERVMVVPKGTPADVFILRAARDLGARIVTNDRYRDWAEAHPEVREAGTLIRGGFRGDDLWLDLDARA
jgi:hypothetical protein